MRFRFGNKMKLWFLTIRVGDGIRMSLYGMIHEEVRIFVYKDKDEQRITEQNTKRRVRQMKRYHIVYVVIYLWI